MTSAGFKAAIPASERPQTHTLDRAATKIGFSVLDIEYMSHYSVSMGSHSVLNNSGNCNLN
jgi:hypothetical protein